MTIVQRIEASQLLAEITGESYEYNSYHDSITYTLGRGRSSLIEDTNVVSDKYGRKTIKISDEEAIDVIQNWIAAKERTIQKLKQFIGEKEEVGIACDACGRLEETYKTDMGCFCGKCLAKKEWKHLSAKAIY